MIVSDCLPPYLASYFVLCFNKLKTRFRVQNPFFNEEVPKLLTVQTLLSTGPLERSSGVIHSCSYEAGSFLVSLPGTLKYVLLGNY